MIGRTLDVAGEGPVDGLGQAGAGTLVWPDPPTTTTTIGPSVIGEVLSIVFRINPAWAIQLSRPIRVPAWCCCCAKPHRPVVDTASSEMLLREPDDDAHDLL
jgi:hypothetical protein